MQKTARWRWLILSAFNSRQYQDFYGNNQDLLLQIVKRKEVLVGTTWAFTARQFAFSSNANPDRIVDIAVDTLGFRFESGARCAAQPCHGWRCCYCHHQSRRACFSVRYIALRADKSVNVGGRRYCSIGD
jgi:hypothetical protein